MFTFVLHFVKIFLATLAVLITTRPFDRLVHTKNLALSKFEGWKNQDITSLSFIVQVLFYFR